jgi:hypothetical protein
LGLDDGCESAGQNIPFATTRAERLINGDPRLSLEERYGSHGKYVLAVVRVARQLMHERLLLREDVRKYIKAAIESDVLR